MSYCLIPKLADVFKQRLIDGTIDPAKLEKATSQERREFFAEFMGEHDAKNVNALFESKLLLKNKQAGYVTWAKTITGIKPEVRTDILSKIDRLDKVLNPAEEKLFLNDLANKRLGLDVTYEEAQKITTGAKEIATLKDKIPVESPIGSSERLEYGFKKAMFSEYLKDLKNKTNAPTFKEWITSPTRIVKDVAGTMKSVLASLDNSFQLRQGIKMLGSLRNADIWTKNFVKSWGLIGKELMGIDAMVGVRADVVSRPNALNGKYKAGGYALDILSEEAFPSSAPERIPLLGRLFKASESAYNGTALRMRADYADRIIAKAEKFGVDTLNAKEAAGLGKLVNSMTGRGHLGKAEPAAELVNATLFSGRFLKANYDVLTAHSGGFGIEPGVTRSFVRREAAKNLLGIIASTAGVLWVANQLYPGSVNSDSRGSDFGKIKIGTTRFDITGGMSGIITLASKLIPTKHNDEWHLYSKSTTTGKVTNLLSGKYGQPTAFDAILGFFEGKLSPALGIFRDIYKGQNFQGDRPTAANLTRNALTPLPIQTYEQMLKTDEGANRLMTLILEELGVNTNTYSK